MHPIENILKTTMDEIARMIDVNTIVGDAVETTDGNVIIPISQVSVGFVSGGGEYGTESSGKERTSDNTAGEASVSNRPFAGGSGAGTCIKPVAFLVVNSNKVKVMPVHFNSIYDRLVELVPQVLEELHPLVQLVVDKFKPKYEGAKMI